METDKLVDFDHVTDYISREAAKQRIRDSFSDLAHRCEINAILNSIPAADVVEVVRCKDCTYFSHVKCQEERAGLCEHFDAYMYISDYCSDGYRRDDNG